MNIICFITTSLAFLQEVDVEKPENWHNLLKLMEGIIISCERHDEFQENLQEKLMMIL